MSSNPITVVSSRRCLSRTSNLSDYAVKQLTAEVNLLLLDLITILRRRLSRRELRMTKAWLNLKVALMLAHILSEYSDRLQPE